MSAPTHIQHDDKDENSNSLVFPYRPTSQQEALELLVFAIELAQSRGAFTIRESSEISSAIDLFGPLEDSTH